MVESTNTGRVIFIVLQQMRRPILTLIVVYATSMIGWFLIPAIDDAGNPQSLSFFHAFYFLTYTATTTGFGELPYTFSEAQRMWGIVSLYASVIAWFYAAGSIIHLLQNPHFQQAVGEHRFAKSVARIKGPFYILCGFGNTGSLLTRGLSDAHMATVIIDHDPERIKALALRDYRLTMPGLCGDARFPDHLIEAGLLHPNCKAVIALTPDKAVNEKIAVTACLLNPSVQVIVKSGSDHDEELLATLTGDVHVIEPFRSFARYISAAVASPELHVLSQWLSGTHGASLKQHFEPPHGRWIICGFGRMGRSIRDALEAEGISTVVIEPIIDEEEAKAYNVIVGHANGKTLREAGIETAAGVVAATDQDSQNLSILLVAKSLNPKIFRIVRQNRHRNEKVFLAAEANFIMQPSLVTARRILFMIVAPMLREFFEALRKRNAAEAGHYLEGLLERLHQVVGGSEPRIWSLDISEASAVALCKLSNDGLSITLDTLLQDPSSESGQIACVPLMMISGERHLAVPQPSDVVRPGDRLLLCGTPHAQRLLDATLNNEYSLRHLATGEWETRSLLLKWLLHNTKALPAAKAGSS